MCDGFCVFVEGFGVSVVIVVFVVVDDVLFKMYVLGELFMVMFIVGVSEYVKVSVKECMMVLFLCVVLLLEFIVDYAGDKRKKFYDVGCVVFVMI